MKHKTVKYKNCNIKIEHKNVKTGSGSITSLYVATIDLLPDCTEYQDSYEMALQLAKEDIDISHDLR